MYHLMYQCSHLLTGTRVLQTPELGANVDRCNIRSVRVWLHVADDSVCDDIIIAGSTADCCEVVHLISVAEPSTCNNKQSHKQRHGVMSRSVY